MVFTTVRTQESIASPRLASTTIFCLQVPVYGEGVYAAVAVSLPRDTSVTPWGQPVTGKPGQVHGCRYNKPTLYRRCAVALFELSVTSGYHGHGCRPCGVCFRRGLGMFVRLENVFPLISDIPPPQLDITVIVIGFVVVFGLRQSETHGRNPCLSCNEKNLLYCINQ